MENYIIIEEIFQGTYGKIHKVQRIKDKKIFACKELIYGQMDDKQKQQLIQEVNILRELKNQNIVRYFDRIIDKKNQIIYIIMEYCQKGDLQRLIDQQKINNQKFEEKQIWDFIIQIFQALLEIHRRKQGIIIHRDIKPSNIFIDENFNLKLGDFGLAKILNEEQFQQTGFKNIHYLSPEQLNENVFTEKTDIWAFSCIIYELVHLRPPFQGQNQMQMALNISKQKIEITETEYSIELQRLIQWGLEKDYKRRPSIDEIMNLPEISFHLRNRRLKENQQILQRKSQDLEIKKQSIQKIEKIQQDRIQQFLQKDEELKIQLIQLQKIYQESIQEQIYNQQDNNLKNQQFKLQDYKFKENQQQNQLIQQQEDNFFIGQKQLNYRPKSYRNISQDQIQSQDLYQDNEQNNIYENKLFMNLKKNNQIQGLPISQITSQLQSKNKYLQKVNTQFKD